MSAVRSRQHPPATRQPDAASGVVVQLVRIPACHAGGRGFESRPLRQPFPTPCFHSVKRSLRGPIRGQYKWTIRGQSPARSASRTRVCEARNWNSLLCPSGVHSSHGTCSSIKSIESYSTQQGSKLPAAPRKRRAVTWTTARSQPIKARQRRTTGINARSSRPKVISSPLALAHADDRGRCMGSFRFGAGRLRVRTPPRAPSACYGLHRTPSRCTP
jgi:hypothetical protein